jgi:hypothetical protein
MHKEKPNAFLFQLHLLGMYKVMFNPNENFNIVLNCAHNKNNNFGCKLLKMLQRCK